MIKAGADIKEISNLDGEEARRVRYLEDLCLGLRSVRKPLLAAVEGMAVRHFSFFVGCNHGFAPRHVNGRDREPN